MVLGEVDVATILQLIGEIVVLSGQALARLPYKLARLASAIALV